MGHYRVVNEQATSVARGSVYRLPQADPGTSGRDGLFVMSEYRRITGWLPLVELGILVRMAESHFDEWIARRYARLRPELFDPDRRRPSRGSPR